MAQYGRINIDGQDYIERPQVFVSDDIPMFTGFSLHTQQYVALPGVANFLLKGLTKEITGNGTGLANLFKFRLGNSDGQTWYISGGIGSSTDRAINTAVLGSGEFPYTLVPPIPYSAGSNIRFEVEDVTGFPPATSYTINLAFHGSYLIPVGAQIPGTPSNGTSPGSVYGMITLDGQQYIERHQVFVAEVQVTTPGQVLTNLRLSLPGTANFLLKGLTRELNPQQTASGNITLSGFRFRIVNSEGSTWFFGGGLGIFDDRVCDSLCFGSGQFPFLLIPPVPVHATGSLIYEIEDLALPQVIYPYTIYLGFHGSLLFPPDLVMTMGPLALPGVTHGIIRTG